MKIYVFYFFTAVLNAWLIAFYLGISAGFASIIPILALLGSCLLFVIALPILIYNTRIGSIIGLIACLMILPYGIGIFFEIIKNVIFHWGIVILTPFTFTLISIYFSLNILFNKSKMLKITSNNILKVVLCSFPVLLFTIYLFFKGKYWLIYF